MQAMANQTVQMALQLQWDKVQGPKLAAAVSIALHPREVVAALEAAPARGDPLFVVLAERSG